jgi:hypothetical protein
VRLILGPEEAWDLGQKLVLDGWPVDSTLNGSGLPPTLSPSSLRRLLNESPQWLRPVDRIRVDMEVQGPVLAPRVERVRSDSTARGWERAFLREAHHRRLLAGELVYGAVTWPGTAGRALLVLSDDGYARHRALIPSDMERTARVDVTEEWAVAAAQKMEHDGREAATVLGQSPSA